jgi:hypothetical protein
VVDETQGQGRDSGTRMIVRKKRIGKKRMCKKAMRKKTMCKKKT